jgi:RNA polymerase sigma factor (sigma-70 family)
MIEPSRRDCREPARQEPARQEQSCREQARAVEPASWDAFWDAFVRRHGRELQRAVAGAMARCGLRPEPEQVEELVQEVYCRLLARRTAAVADRPPAQLWAYLHRIARSVVVDELRSRLAGKRGGGQCREQPVETLVDRPAPGMSPEELLLAGERAELLRQRVRRLYPGAQGERNLRVLELAVLEGMTSGEISRRLGGELTPSSVHTVLHRLRRHLAAAGDERTAGPSEVVTSALAAVG